MGSKDHPAASKEPLGVSPIGPNVPSSSTLQPLNGDSGFSTGRISNDNHNILKRGFADIEKILNDLQRHTGLAASQILKLWNKQTTASHSNGNLWNVYEKYFRANKAVELERLRPDPDGNVPAKTARNCFTAFKQDLPDTWVEILEIYAEADILDSSDTTVAERGRQFHKFTEKIIDMVRFFLFFLLLSRIKETHLGKRLCSTTWL
jgi:hypothetical protein